MRSRLFDSSILATAQQAVEFVSNILESSTEYSLIGKDLDGKILLWNEGARRMYGYEAEEVVGKLNSDVLHTPEDVATGKPREIMAAALRNGKWEGVIGRVRKDGRRISARVVITPRRDTKGKPVGFLSSRKTSLTRFVSPRRFARLNCLTMQSSGMRRKRSISLPTFWNLRRSTQSSVRTSKGRSFSGTKAHAGSTDMSQKKWWEKLTLRFCTRRKTSPPANLANCSTPPCETGNGKAPFVGFGKTDSNSPPE